MLRDREYLLDILEAAKLALSYTSGKTLQQFEQDTQCQDAVIRRIEIMGEAARRVSESTRQLYPHLPWTEMTGMRNLLIHEYEDVDPVIVWNTATKDLPPLVGSLEKLLQDNH